MRNFMKIWLRLLYDFHSSPYFLIYSRLTFCRNLLVIISLSQRKAVRQRDSDLYLLPLRLERLPKMRLAFLSFLSFLPVLNFCKIFFGSSAIIELAYRPYVVHCSDDLAYSVGNGETESDIIIYSQEKVSFEFHFFLFTVFSSLSFLLLII